MLYLWLKFIHVLSSTILFGTGIGTACVMLYAYTCKSECETTQLMQLLLTSCYHLFIIVISIGGLY